MKITQNSVFVYKRDNQDRYPDKKAQMYIARNSSFNKEAYWCRNTSLNHRSGSLVVIDTELIQERYPLLSIQELHDKFKGYGVFGELTVFDSEVFPADLSKVSEGDATADLNKNYKSTERLVNKLRSLDTLQFEDLTPQLVQYFFELKKMLSNKNDKSK